MFIWARRRAEPITKLLRLKVKVTVEGHEFLTLQFRVCSISPEPFERFSLNVGLLSLSWCAEPINQPCRLIVKVIFFHVGHLENHPTSGWDPIYRVLSSWYTMNNINIKVRKATRSGIDTIKYNTWPRIPHGKVTKTIKHHKQEPRGQSFPSRWPQGSNEQTRKHDKHNA